HDVVVGNLSLPGVPGPVAGPGYDLATGWGSFDAPALLAAFDPGPPCESDGDCDDGNLCTQDRCALGGCRHAALPGGSACRTIDCAPGSCIGDVCVSTGAAGCDDADPCTRDFCANQGLCAQSVTIGADAVRCVFVGGDVVTPGCAGQHVPHALGQ